jgi:hypothetical protein
MFFVIFQLFHRWRRFRIIRTGRAPLLCVFLPLTAAGLYAEQAPTAAATRPDPASEVWIDVNQAFYAPSAVKKAVVRCRQAPTNGCFSIQGKDADRVLEGSLKYWGQLWDQHFWILDFSKLRQEGTYAIEVKFDGDCRAQANVVISTDRIQQAVAKTLEYFAIQRCGVDVPGWHKACHKDDGVLPSGRHRDATGGWHDCAGFDKEMYTTFLPVYFYATIASESNLAWKSQMLDEAKWGAEWIMKMTDPNGYIWCHVEPHNAPPELYIKTWTQGVDTDNQAGTPDDRKLTVGAWGPEEACQAANLGALAKLAFVLKNGDADFSRRCVQKANQIRDYLKNTEFKYGTVSLGKSNSHYALFHSGMLLADVYLSKLQPATEYLEDAHARIDFLLNETQTRRGDFLTSSVERVPQSKDSIAPHFGLLCLAEFAKAFPDDPKTPLVNDAFKLFLNLELSRRLKQSPYGQARRIDAELVNWVAVRTSDRFFEKPSGKVSQGSNCYWLSLATVCFVAGDLLETKEHAAVAVSQIDWVLGNNPFGLSTAATIGTKFPRMFTMYYWLKDHPGSAGVIPGGVINGIGGDSRDLPYIDTGNSNWMAWETNEYWNPPTAWFSMACWQYYKFAGGTEKTAE